MDFSTNVLGTTAVNTLQHRVKDAILEIGRDRFTRRDLAKVDCFNFTAAQNLSHILNRELKVPDVRHVYFHIHPVDLALPRLGTISLAVLGAAFEARGLGGDDPLDSWWKRHNVKRGTFDTIKAREERIQEEEKRKKRANGSRRLRLAHAS